MYKHFCILIFAVGLLPMAALAQYASSITVETLLKTDSTSIGQRIAYPSVQHAEVTMLKITMPPGSSTGWHKHEIPLFAYVMQGELTVMHKNRPPKVFKAGDAIAEMIHVFHEGVNKGKQDVVLIGVYLGGDNRPLAESHTQ